MKALYLPLYFRKLLARFTSQTPDQEALTQAKTALCSASINASKPPQPRCAYCFSFFELPHELRDIIYALVAQSPTPVPSSPADAVWEVRNLNEFPTCFIQPPLHNTLPLQLCSHQIYVEVLFLTTQRSASDHFAHLDLLIGSTNIYCTWISLPPRVLPPHTIHVDFRFEGPNCHFSHLRNMLWWDLFELLQIYFKYRPALKGT
jgi:hypothetical protein